ncbi:MAG: hypothetical protein M3137_11990, partial [Actinomycetota bacterium]|nr:hypothetical protein [Actinomycetota bacterium]
MGDDHVAGNDKVEGADGLVGRRPLTRTAARQPSAKRPAVERSTSTEPATPAPPPTRTTNQGSFVTRVLHAIDKRGDDPDQTGSPVRMRGNEATLGYAAAAVLTIIPVIFLTVTTGKGAPAHPVTAAAAIGVVLGLVMAASIRLSNRILTAFLAVGSSLATTATAVPTSVRPLSTVDLLAALGFAMLITLR